MLSECLTRWHINADNGQSTARHLRQDFYKFGPNRWLKAEAKDGVDDDVVGVTDEARIGGKVVEERDSHLLTLCHQVLKQWLRWPLWVVYSWLVALHKTIQQYMYCYICFGPVIIHCYMASLLSLSEDASWHSMYMVSMVLLLLQSFSRNT